jgi:hypothetical protein
MIQSKENLRADRVLGRKPWVGAKATAEAAKAARQIARSIEIVDRWMVAKYL